MDDAARLRVGDAERDAVAADLREHFALGRISAEELDERLGVVYAARTRGELAAVQHDLPSLRPVVQPEPVTPWNPPFAPRLRGRARRDVRRAYARRGPHVLPLVAIVVAVGLVAGTHWIALAIVIPLLLRMALFRRGPWRRHG